MLEATWTPAVGTLGFDNRLPASLGNWELNGAVAVNSPLGYGEQFYGAASTGYDLGKVFDATTPMQLLGAGAVLPIGVDGWKINPEYTNSVTRPAPTPWAPADVGYYQRFDLRASYPLILTRAQALTFQATYEWAQEHLSPIGFDTDIYDDQYNVARLQLEDHLRLPYGLLAGTLVFSQGLGGRGETQALLTGVPLSQQGAFPTFSKLGLDATWTQPLPYDLQGTLIGQAQTSFGHPLFIAEQFSLDGLQAASAYPLGTFSVDEGRHAPRRDPAAVPLRVDARPRDSRALHIRRRFARLDRRSDCAAAGPRQRRIVWRWPAFGRRYGDARPAARRDLHRRTRSRLFERRRRGTGLSLQRGVRGEILKLGFRGSSGAQRCRCPETESGRAVLLHRPLLLRRCCSSSLPRKPRMSSQRGASSRPARRRSVSRAPISR